MKFRPSPYDVTAALCLAAILGACSEEQGVAEVGAEPVLCALEGEGEWSDDCRLETARVGGANVFVIRHPNGGFRRLVERGEGFASVDGFETARSEVREDRIYVTIGNDSYNFPAQASQ
ncbi:hypothetical protein [Qipengyuania sp. 902]|uniref:hypothetical protein n=1 Tax=Qipengyuania sp. 902 TaxID=3417565 RepID=UPI003EB97140